MMVLMTNSPDKTVDKNTTQASLGGVRPEPLAQWSRTTSPGFAGPDTYLLQVTVQGTPMMDGPVDLLALEFDVLRRFSEAGVATAQVTSTELYQLRDA